MALNQIVSPVVMVFLTHKHSLTSAENAYFNFKSVYIKFDFGEFQLTSQLGN